MFWLLAAQQAARRQLRIHFRQGQRHLRTDAPDDVFRAQLFRMVQTGCRQYLREGFHGIFLEMVNPLLFVERIQAFLAVRILGGDTGRAAVGMAGL